MKMAEDTLNSSQKSVYAVGPIIHNDQAMEKLTSKGLLIEEDLERIKKKSSAIIRSHGLPKHFYDRMVDKEICIVDATCPFVKKIQNIVFEASNKGYEVIIIGDKSHPEVIGLSGWIQKEHTVLNTVEEALEFTGLFNKKYIVVVQTTFKLEIYTVIEKILGDKIKDVEFHNTICYATKQRQESAESLAQKVDAMIVIGGKKSSNTLKLAEICRKHCKTILVETIKDLDASEIRTLEYIGIVAGASTPDFIIEEVHDYIVNKIKV
ncbi:MAG: 4-hydroxy-3-methylbut-2-enyl diphosphate reductase [Peptostreptococcaceae bacterium]|nr:4-hydroxy-3-methylbut-2-enyl diphosphate reductase [Peptostreptococcaceae bacterium]